MRKHFEDNLIIDEGFAELVELVIRAQDDIDIAKLLENDQEEEIDIYKKAVHPLHLLDDLKELYDRHGVKWYQNDYGNVYARGETCRGTPYVFYVNWVQCSTVRFYTESGKSFFLPFGGWTWDMVPIDEMISYQNRNRIVRKRKHSENEDEQKTSG